MDPTSSSLNPTTKDAQKPLTESEVNENYIKTIDTFTAQAKVILESCEKTISSEGGLSQRNITNLQDSKDPTIN